MSFGRILGIYPPFSLHSLHGPGVVQARNNGNKSNLGKFCQKTPISLYMTIHPLHYFQKKAFLTIHTLHSIHSLHIYMFDLEDEMACNMAGKVRKSPQHLHCLVGCW